VEEGALTRVGGRWEADPGLLASRTLPASIHEAVLARLGTAPQEQVALLRRLAPAGRTLELPMVRALADLPESELFSVLDGIVERQFLQEEEGRYVFTHDTVHQAVYDSMPEDERRAAHARVAMALQTLYFQRPDLTRTVGWHYLRSPEPELAIGPLLEAGRAAMAAQAMLEATLLLKEASTLLESAPDFPGRDRLLLRIWVTLVEVGYASDPPSSLVFAEKLFAHWAATVDLEEGRRSALAQLDAACSAPEAERPARLRELLREREADARSSPADIFWKQAELQILQGMALAIVGRTKDLDALLERVRREQPDISPYRAGTLLSQAVLCAYTGQSAGVLEAQAEQLARLRGLRDVMGWLPRRLAWSLGMGGYMMNLNLALRGEPLDAQATRDGCAVAEEHGFTDVRAFHLFSEVARAAFTGDGAAFVPAFTEKTDLVRRLGNPRLMERNLAIFTPPYYLERGEHEHVAAVVARAETLARVLPEDRWLQCHVRVYQACRDILFEDTAAARESLPRALVAASEAGVRMGTLLLVYQSRFEREQGHLDVARAAAEAALARAVEPSLANPWDEILARRALAALLPGPEGRAHLERALVLARQTGNVLQVGLVHLALAEREGAGEAAVAELAEAEAAFTEARAPSLLAQATSLRGVLQRGVDARRSA